MTKRVVQNDEWLLVYPRHSNSFIANWINMTGNLKIALSDKPLY